VVLLSEWDTFFGRALPAAFDRAYRQQCDRSPSCLRSTAYKFYYFRGIDGVVASEPEAAGKTELSSTTTLEDERNSLLNSFIRRPAGTGQFDYLRRFVEQIKDLDGKRRIGDEKPIKAIGLFGSDVYDKLLILRALRPWFPDKLFFTTDLDAHLLHPAEFRWTRNLLVASSFDLSPPDDYPSGQPGIDPVHIPRIPHIPRFRDAYQTSIFLATRIATDRAYRPNWLRVPGLSSTPQIMRAGNVSGATSSKPALLIKPYLFEIGRGIAVRLNDNNQDDWVDIVQKAALGIVFFLAFLSVFLLHQMKPNVGWPVLGFFILFVLLAAFTWLAVIEDGHLEPLSFSKRISIWPTEILRVLALLLSLFLFARVISDLRLNAKRIEAKYFTPRSHRRWTSMEPTLKEIFAPLLGISSRFEDCKRQRFTPSRSGGSSEGERLSQSQDEPRGETPVARRPVREAWGTWLPITTVFFLAVLWLTFNLDNYIMLDSWWHLVLAWALIITIWFSILHRGFKIRSTNAYFRCMNLPTNNTNKTNEYVGVREVWDTYQAYGSIRDCVLRATAYLIVYLAFADLLFYLFGSNFTPARGDVSQFIHRIVLISSLSQSFCSCFLS
jgi:threonine/homoserine/homoserine lactone efflux protein